MTLIIDKKNNMLDSREIKLLIIHCSDTPNEHVDKVDARFIHNMHLGFGWDGIGYHKIICRNGKIENGRPEYWIGAHVKGKNEISLGVCLIGQDNFTKKQFKSLEIILKKWKLTYPNAKIIGHRESTITNKTCPNFNVANWCKERNIN
jgi:N-acetylmuramoyl-L-alanine amidase